jgi:Domain of unknown function (DUF5615)
LAANAGRWIVALSERILIDECLSVSLVAAAKERGLIADHVTYIGKAGWQDYNLVPFAVEINCVIVTNNRRHFLREYAKLDVHNGLIVIVPAVRRELQQAPFEKALDTLSKRNNDIVNKVVEVLLDGRVEIREWTSEDHDLGPRRTAILLIGGDKTGDNRFYETMIPIADGLYDAYLAELKKEGLIT